MTAGPRPPVWPRYIEADEEPPEPEEEPTVNLILLDQFDESEGPLIESQFDQWDPER